MYAFAGNFLIFSTVLGIKVLNLVTNKVVRTLGLVESSERFCHLVRAYSILSMRVQYHEYH